MFGPLDLGGLYERVTGTLLLAAVAAYAGRCLVAGDSLGFSYALTIWRTISTRAANKR